MSLAAQLHRAAATRQVDVPSRDVVAELLPEISRFRRRGGSFSEVTRLLSDNGLVLKMSTVEQYVGAAERVRRSGSGPLPVADCPLVVRLRGAFDAHFERAGRRKRFPDGLVADVQRLHREGMSHRTIAELLTKRGFKCSPTTIRNVCNRSHTESTDG